MKHSYTLEASYFGYRSKGELFQFSVKDYEECGVTLLHSFQQYLPNKKKLLLLLARAAMMAFQKDFTGQLRADEAKRLSELNDVEAQRKKSNSFIKPR